ncbi:hypothetical protein, partial [Albidovulum sp.]|uniref:hypothetical protein n=1 Tax=Albidovulum sp. TaxID=1872424 RepID=UPI003D7E96FB
MSGLLAAAAVDASPYQMVAAATCVFDKRCDLRGADCQDWQTDVAMRIWKLPTRLMTSDRSAPPIAYGFETIGGYTEFEVYGRKLKGEAFFDIGERRVGPIWDYELPGASLSYRARNAAFDAWLMFIAADGAAHLTITQNDSTDRARHIG